MPFHELRNDGAIVMALFKGKRPTRPSAEISDANGLSDSMWALMEKCWREFPRERPTSTQIVEALSNFPSAKAEEPMSCEWTESLPSRPSYFLTQNPLANVLLGRIQERLRR